MAEPPAKRARRQNETQIYPGPSTAPDRQAAATQKLADGERDDQQTTHGSRQPSQQEPPPQPPPQLQPRPGETQTNPGPSTAPIQQLPADGVRDDQQTTQSGSGHPSQQEPTPQPPPQLQPRPGETQTNPGPSTAPIQQLPADGVRDDQQTTQSGSGHPSQQEPTPQPPPQLQPGPDKADANESAEKHMKRKAEATVLKDQGNQAFQKGDYTRAVELYTQGLECLKDFVVLYTNRAQAYNKLEKFSEAMEDCRTALQLEPNNVKALVHLGKAQQGLKDYEAAVTTFQEILKIDEKYEKMVADNVKRAQEADASERAEKRKAEATVLKDQGNQAFKKSDYARAVELYTQGLERLKDFVVLYTNRAQAYNKLEKFTEAMEDCRTALQLEPNNVKALVHLGKAQQGLKDYEVAVTTYQEILKIDKKHKKIVAGYIAAVNLAKSTAKSDMEAERLFNEGDVKAMGVHEIGLSEVADSQAALTQQLPDDQQTTQSGSRQPSQQEPMPQPTQQLQPRPGETQTNPGPSTAPTQQLPADGVRDDQQTTQSGSRQPSQQEPMQQPPPQLQPRPEANLDKEHPEVPGITEPVLRKISERLGSEWQKLATHLGLSAAEIERIMMDDPGQTENQIFNMLAEWRRQQRDVLCTALVKLGKMDIAEDMIDFSDPVLRKISERLGSKWQKLATHLGLSAAEIERIVMDDPGQTENQILNMLIEWRRKQREVLCTALMEIGRTNIAEDLIGISDLDLRMISNKLGSEWRKLATHLGLRPATIDRIVMDNPGQTENQIFSMLVKWRRQQSTSTDQRDVLCTALMEISRRDIVEDLIEAQVGGAKEQNRQRRTTSSERQGQGDVGHRDKSHQEVQERGAKEQSKLKSTSSSEGQRQNQQEAGGTHPNVQKETLQSSEEHGLKGSTDHKPAYAQVGVTPRNQSEIRETAVKEMTSQDQQLMQGPKSVQDIVPVGQTSSRSPAVLRHGPAQLVSVDSMSFSGENSPVFLGAVNQPTFTLNVQSLKVTEKSSGFPKVSIATDVTRQGGEDRGMNDVLRIALTTLHRTEGKDYVLEQISAFLNSCDGELEEVIPGSVTFVVRFKSREGLNKLWSMYTTGELAKKLTEILITVLITDELTTEDKSDLAIKATIPESDYDRACKFFEELEKDQQKDEEDSSSMEEVQHKQLGESSTATRASSSDPTEYAEDSYEEKVMKTSFITTGGIGDPDLYKISAMFGSEWQKLATHLGLSAAEIDRIEMADPGQTENQIFNMLVKWRGKQGEVLYKVLMKMGRTDIVEELIGFSDLILHKISGMLGSEWRKLATHLGLSAAEIERIVMDDPWPGQTENQIFNMLVKWRCQQSTSTDQREVLFIALKQIKGTDTAKDVIEITGLQGPGTFEDLQQEIIDNYKQTATTIPAHPILQSCQVGTEEFFVPLHLIKHIPGKTKSVRSVRLPEGDTLLDINETITLNSLDDLLNPEVVKEIKILLYGGVGTGKSTLLVKVVNSCITLGSKALRGRFDLVLWIKLRQMQQSSCVLDAIFDQILAQDTKLTKSIVKGFIAAHESHIALLLDGVDQIPSHVLQSEEGVYRVQDILHNRVLTKSFVLVTTRPHMVDSILEGHPTFARVETTGFNPQDRDQYIRLNLPDDADMGEALVSYLKTNQHLSEMSKVPIISQMMCLVWKNQKSLPERITELFTKFAKVLFIRRNEEMGDQHMMSIIDDLGRVALQGLLDSSGERLMFNETELQNCQSSLAEGCHVGFVQRETFTCGLDVKVLVTFPHKSIQEYFAACHLVKLLQDDENNFRHQLKQIREHNVHAMEYLLRFCCGRSGKAAGLILDHIQKMQGDEMKLQRLARLLFFESSSKELATKLVRPTEVYCESNEDLKSLSYYLQHVTPPLKGTGFKIDVRKQELTLLRGILLSDSMKSDELIYVDYFLSEQEEKLSLLEETLGVVDVQHPARLHILIHIEAKSWFDVGHVSHSLFCMQEQIYVGRLGLVMNQRSPDEVVDLLKALEGCRLGLLSLFNIDLHAQMGDVSHVLSSLTILLLIACRLVDDDVKDLISILPAGHGLERLALDGNAFSLDAVRALTHHLQGLPKLRGLRLCNIGLSAELIRQVVSQNLPHLKETEEGEFEKPK
ncbi:uncharacterized protein LOC119733183 isoform X2 [Patiria miniata]|uniref:Uncharacterized protein n=1 Tax=Patiria miniata TaxID=46514 RepID=A0A914AH23_PATMI|nr:uncharacterized protein LOC119733183 isoform X2 [Patiria miniata]